MGQRQPLLLKEVLKQSNLRRQKPLEAIRELIALRYEEIIYQNITIFSFMIYYLN